MAPTSPVSSHPVRLLTVGHGTLPQDELGELLVEAGIEALVDVRTAPGSRRHPHVSRQRLSRWLAESGVAYRWEPRLGGWRTARPGSPNGGLRNAAFRGYADWMAEPPFTAALDQLLDQAAGQVTAAMCSETLWWRCHRRLLADAAVLLAGAEVVHLIPGRREEHQLTEGVVVIDGTVRYPPPAP